MDESTQQNAALVEQAAAAAGALQEQAARLATAISIFKLAQGANAAPAAQAKPAKPAAAVRPAPLVKSAPAPSVLRVSAAPTTAAPASKAVARADEDLWETF